MKTNKQNQSPARQKSRITLKQGFLAIMFISYLLSSSYAFASSAGIFQIRQERTESNGILVSRPSKMDVEIAKLLKDNNLHTPQEYAQWLAKNISFKSDGGADAWATPLETLGRKYGDCEDFTFLNIAVLRVMGYDAKFVAFFSSSVQNHAICIFEDKGQFYYFDNMNLKKIDESSVLEFAKNKMAKNRYFLSKELNVESKKWELLYKTS